MADLALLLIGALLVNNFVLAQFLGLCPFMGITKGYDTALATGIATTFVLSFSALCAHLLYHGILAPLGLEYLRIILFIVVIAGVVQLVKYYLQATSPVLHQLLGIYLPLITSNCAVLGVALLAINANLNTLETLIFSLGASGGFTGVMVLFGAIREVIDHDDVPAAFRGTPLALVTAGLMSLAFMGFQGLAG
ncbi:electron transport complex subunit RsxA [bacterium]|jgi:Na+-translocating ferredoxin:NAD+ oxidoreductase subunit A|nr:electron transport complex subunit RsxA [Pseudomonadales bacterium]MDB3937040.1 electron transport complex subunit RsxA [bacterium]